MRIGGILALVIAAAPQAAQASSLDLFGFGARSPALAGTGVAFADDYEAVYANPAGLAEVHVRRATVGFVGADFDLMLNDESVGGTASATVLGGVFPIPLGGWAKDRIGVGIGLYVPNDTLNRARAPFPGEPSFALLDTRAHVIAVNFGVGVRLSTRWSVGASVIALAALRGTIDVTTDAGGRFTADSEQQLVTQIAPVLGAKWRRDDRLTIGAAVRGPSRSDYDIQVTSDLGTTIPLELPDIRIAGVAQYDPLMVAAEAAWKLGDVTAIGQLAWHRWSAYPLPTQNPVVATPPQQDPGFHDTVVPRIAAELARQRGALALAARAGYAFLWSPAPEMRGQQTLLDNHRHLFSFGFGVGVSGRVPVRIDVYAQVQALMRRRHVKDPALQPDGELPPFDAVSTRGKVFVAGAALGVDL